MGQSTSSHSVSPNGLIEDPDWYKYEEMTVEEINKIQLGKLIIKYCGHEGTTDDEQTASIRKLLQRAITNLEPQQKQYPGVWRDAELKIFDLYGNGYVVKSGEGSVKFVAQITEKGDARLSKINDDKSFLAAMTTLFRRQNSQQLQMKGAPPDQSNARQGLLSSNSLPLTWLFGGSKPESNQGEGLSQSSTEHDKRSFDSPSLMESDSNDKDVADEQHQNNSLVGHDQGAELLNDKPCPSSGSSANSSDTDKQEQDDGKLARLKNTFSDFVGFLTCSANLQFL
ncbi:uncharacterized protein LOC144927154 [Branchiostoma floridae x Branchiostoma belcheri]